MLNVGKLVGERSAQYYLDTVARGVEDYYLHAGEAPGMWHGSAAMELGLAGEVSATDLMALLRGEHPSTGKQLAQPQRSGERVWGFDLTFRAPKSVSLLFALGENGVPREVRSAHELAVGAALGYLEREACFGRRRVDGEVRPVPTSGFVAAAFQHRTSRAGDPLLHTHLLVANLVRAEDGRWGALDARLLYSHAKAAGALYQAELRHQLSRRLGVHWTPVCNGLAEVEGVPAPVILAFSQRRQEILAHLSARGETSARAAQVATLETRRAKDHRVNPEGLLPEWRQRAVALGFGPERLAGVLGRPDAAVMDSATDAEIAERVLGADGLTAHASSFTRREVVLAVCDQLGPDMAATAVECFAELLLRDPGVVCLQNLDAHGSVRSSPFVPAGAGPDQRRFTTRELLEIERRLVESATSRKGRVSLVPAPRVVERTLAARPSLSEEQLAMCRQLLSSWDGVQVVRGHAGTGKTYALDACRAAWDATGLKVVGCSLSARAAAELEAGAGIRSLTLHRLLDELDWTERSGLGTRVRVPGGPPVVEFSSRTVVVVDEAGMVGSRQLADLLERADHARARVVLVGDDHQLPEIEAGGGFRALAERLGAIELSDNRRQREQWEREALHLLRAGDAEQAIAAYTAHQRVVIGDSAEAVRTQLVADWWAARTAEGERGGAVMVAARRADVRELNERAHALRVAAGEVHGPELALPGGDIAVGEEVMTKRNDRCLEVRNGSRGTVVGVDVEQGTVDLQLTEERELGRLVRLPRAYLEDGHLVPAYALTAHAAQGMTTERAFVLGDDTVYREWGYVAMSRGREENRLYAVSSQASKEADQASHGHGPAVVPAIDGVLHGLQRSRAQQLALDQTSPAPTAQSETPTESDEAGFVCVRLPPGVRLVILPVEESVTPMPPGPSAASLHL
ncbi:MAG: MobF family relaxase [Candidatus Dormibacteria bacterium]